MLSRSELQDLLKAGESDRVEKTESTNDTSKFSEAICAFSNDMPYHRQPGYLLIGVKDNGDLTGLKVNDQLQQNLAGLRSAGNILPLPVITVGSFSFPEGDVAVVEVLPSDMPPVRYKGQIWIRVGPRRAIASQQEEKILTERRAASAKTFDVEPCRESTIDDLSLDIFLNTYRPHAVAEEVIKENHREIPDQLAALRLFDKAYNCPTHAGVLLFAKNPLYHLSGAYIQFLRFEGTTESADIAVEKKLSGDLLTVLRELDALVDVQISKHPVLETHLQEKMMIDYPTIALRELLMNAVMHRSYDSTAPIRFYWFSDRVEIQNPGGLYGEASEKNFPKQNAYRNPVLAEAMKILGYVNKFGSGVNRANESLAKNGSKPADFSFDANYVLVTVWKKP